MRETQNFAYGANTVESCPCPALAVGFNPDGGDKSIEPAEWYDTIVQGEEMNQKGILSEEKAKEYWLKTIEVVKSRGDTDSEGIAKEIAERLNWL